MKSGQSIVLSVHGDQQIGGGGGQEASAQGRRVGDRLEVIHPSGNREIALERIENAEAAQINVAPGNGHRVWIPLPANLPGALLARFV